MDDIQKLMIEIDYLTKEFLDLDEKIDKQLAKYKKLDEGDASYITLNNLWGSIMCNQDAQDNIDKDLKNLNTQLEQALKDK